VTCVNATSGPQLVDQACTSREFRQLLRRFLHKCAAGRETQQPRDDTSMSIDTSKGHPAMDYAEHTATYSGFLSLTKYLIAFLIVLLVGMYYFLV
jgi:hypothetical protein